MPQHVINLQSNEDQSLDGEVDLAPVEQLLDPVPDEDVDDVLVVEELLVVLVVDEVDDEVLLVDVVVVDVQHMKLRLRKGNTLRSQHLQSVRWQKCGMPAPLCPSV